MKIIRLPFLIKILIVASLPLSSCASSPAPTKITLPYAARDGITAEVIEYHIAEAESRNGEVEDSPDWIRKSYQGLMFRDLGSLKQEEFHRYRRFLDRGRAYIIVHPAFFTFFEQEINPGSPDRPELNYLERFLSERPLFPTISLMQAEEKVMRDFLEIKSTQQKLIILILPDHYRDSDRYAFRFPRDEYTRFLNEVTNESDSVLYLYSRSMNSGKLRKKDMERLVKFLRTVNPETILVGGSYYGRCVSAFYRKLRKRLDFAPVYLAADLVSLSPSDIPFPTALSLVKSDGKLDTDKLADYISTNRINRQRPIPGQLVNIR